MAAPEELSEPASHEELEKAAEDLVSLLCHLAQFLAPMGDPKAAIDFLLRAAKDPDGVKQDIVMALRGHPEQASKDIAEIAQLIRSPRKILVPVLRDALPAGTPGKRPNITEAREQHMTRIAQTLLPAALRLVELRSMRTRRTIAETVEYLAADFSDQSNLFRKHLDVLEQFFSKAGRRSKPTKAFARQLIYAVVAKELGISISYAERWLSPTLNSKQSDKLKK